MPRIRVGAGPSKRINYDESSEDSCTEGSSRKNNCTADDDEYEPFRSCKSKRKRPRRVPKKRTTKKTAPSSTASTSKNPVFILDSEEESADIKVTENQENNIKKKLTGFFEALDSDDEGKENETVPIVPRLPPQRNKDFYIIFSDSDDDLTTPIPDLNVKELAPTSSGSDVPQVIEKENSSNIKNLDDLLAYTEDILKCGDVIEVTEEIKPKAPMMSMEELQKKTNELLNGVAFCNDAINAFLTKGKKPEAPVAPEKEAIICPVCLDPLGGALQAMATVCGHLFCEPCLKGVVKSTKKCPSCRKGLTKNKYHPIYI